MTPREALYAKLGLIDAPLPEDYSCGGCPACTDRMQAPPSYYDLGRKQNEDRLAAIEAWREEHVYAPVRLKAERSRVEKQPKPVLAWARIR